MKHEEVSDYNVSCIACGAIWQPEVRSPLWWKAKAKAEKGYLDAPCVSGIECGCEKAPRNPDAPYRVVGVRFDGESYNTPFYSMVKACQCFRQGDATGDIVAITGISQDAEYKLRYMPRKPV
jgi:hypothetical protein